MYVETLFTSVATRSRATAKSKFSCGLPILAPNAITAFIELE